MFIYNKSYFNNLKKQHKKTAEIINKIRWKFVEEIPFNIVLDYGSGCGELTKYSPKKENLIIDSYDIGRLNGELYPQTGINHDRYDLIFFNDVIEHVDWENNPDKKIEKILSLTKYICISLPIWDFNGDILKWKHYKPKEHLTYFSEKSIDHFFEAKGFKEVKKGKPECPPREDILTIIYKRVKNEEE